MVFHCHVSYPEGVSSPKVGPDVEKPSESPTAPLPDSQRQHRPQLFSKIRSSIIFLLVPTCTLSITIEGIHYFIGFF